MKILVTGGNGYVGSALLPFLKSTLHDVTILDNGLSGDNEPDTTFTFLKADIRDAHAMRYLIPGFDLIIHLAAIVGVPACSVDEQFSFDVNVMGTQNIVRNLRKDAKIIFTSSVSVYGDKPNQLVTEETVPTPRSNYGLHKLYAENEIKRHTDNYIIVRPATAFGLSKRTRLDVLPNTLIYEALTQPVVQVYEPDVIRPFIHVEDFAAVLFYAMRNRMPWGETYNIGDNRLTRTKGELAKLIGELANTRVEIIEGSDPDKKNYNVSFDKMYNTDFKFGHSWTNNYQFIHAFKQIDNKLETINANPNSFNTVHHVKEYLKAYGNVY